MRKRQIETTAMASGSKIGPFFATLHHAPIELPEGLLTMILLRLRDSTSAAANAEARSLYAGLMGGIGSVCRSCVATSGEGRPDARRAGLAQGSGRS